MSASPPVTVRVYVPASLAAAYTFPKDPAPMLDTVTGRLIRRVPTPYPLFAPPAVADGKIYLGMGNGDFVETAEQVRARELQKMREAGKSREEAGLQGGPSRVITDKAIFGFHPETKQMTLLTIHPGVTLEDVLGNMGFAPLVPAKVSFTEPPEPGQLKLIRESIDPNRMYMG